MKRLTVFILAFLLLIALLPGCVQADKPEGRSISVICTVFPQYDWVRQILGDKADNYELTLLLQNRIDLHNYQPSVDDLVKISTCDLFIYIGGESDKWVASALKDAANQNMIVINLLDVLGTAAKTEEIIEGMEENEQDDQEIEDEDEIEYDEHIWLSLKNARVLCPVIYDALSAIDADNAAEYKNNMNAFIAALSALDMEYQAAVNAAPVKNLLFGDRFPFRYLVDDYGINYHAAFAGCSAETEASFETIIFLANKVDELNLNNIMVTESTDQSIAKTIISNTRGKNQRILVLDAMQSVTSSDVQNGTTYLSVMQSNLNVLKEALQ